MKAKNTDSVKEFYGNRVRVRACGLLFQDESILLVKHKIDKRTLWAPPGGEPKFGETLSDTLIREFKEEAFLNIVPGDFLFMTEYIETPLHAIELFFAITSFSGQLKLGNDPELLDKQVIQAVKFVDTSSLSTIPNAERHRILKNCTNPIELLDKQGQQ